MNSTERGKKLSQANLLRLQLAEFEKKLEKSDPAGTDLDKFMLRYTIRMASADLMPPDKDKTKIKLEVIRREKEKILTRDWTPESSGQIVLLNKDKNLLENPGIDPDMANGKAHSEEAKRLENEVNKNNIIISDRQRALSKYLQTQAKFLEIQASQRLEIQAHQKSLLTPKQILINKIKNLIK